MKLRWFFRYITMLEGILLIWTSAVMDTPEWGIMLLLGVSLVGLTMLDMERKPTWNR